MRSWFFVSLAIVVFVAGCTPQEIAPVPSAEPNPPAVPSSDEGVAEDVTTKKSWPFENSPTAPVFTLKQITSGSRPILLVVHDDEGDWQFLDGGDLNEEDAQVVLLRNVLLLDPTIAELADLPMGWRAQRAALGKPWRREQQ